MPRRSPVPLECLRWCRTLPAPMEKVGVSSAGAGTTWIAGATDLTQPLDKRLAQVIEASIGHTYRGFLDVVATNRKSTPEKVNEVAQGRVWTGAQAKERGLIDDLGGMDLALKSAARRAGLGETLSGPVHRTRAARDRPLPVPLLRTTGSRPARRPGLGRSGTLAGWLTAGARAAGAADGAGSEGTSHAIARLLLLRCALIRSCGKAPSRGLIRAADGLPAVGKMIRGCGFLG